jgi:predicted ester cyclase
LKSIRERKVNDAERHKDLIRRYFEAIDAHPDDPDILDEFVAEDFVDHDPSPGCTPDLEGLKKAYRVFAEASPGTHAIEDMVAEGDRVVTRISAHGRHTGNLFGMEATGREFATTGIAVHRIRDGKIVEHWSEIDMAGVMTQIGPLAPPQ